MSSFPQITAIPRCQNALTECALMVFAIAMTASAAKDVTFQVSICSGSFHLSRCDRQKKQVTRRVKKQPSELRKKGGRDRDERREKRRREKKKLKSEMYERSHVSNWCFSSSLCVLCVFCYYFVERRLKRSDLTIYCCKSSQLSKLVPMSHRTRNVISL